ncbi:MAG: hypothetical protein RLY82_624 [Pseudomonadota bacterium]|jgi:hypothetical protein
MIKTVSLIACAVLLTACGEKAQSMGGIKSDAPPSAGVGTSQYVSPGWKAGDKTSWEQQLRTRAQGQNDYAKSN